MQKSVADRLPSRERLPELDGLRGVAILMVFLLHYVGNSGTDSGGFGSLYRFAQIFRLGWSGVDLFLVLSGFLIGGILLDARTSPNYFKTFYVRRFYRILPVYYSWITLFAVVGYAVLKWGPSEDLRVISFSLPIWVYYLFLQNMVVRPASLFTHYWMSTMWSLGVEEQFYLVAPLLIRYLSRRRLMLALIGCIVGAPILRFLVFSRGAAGREFMYILMPCRADALAMGMLAAVAWRTSAKVWLAERISLLKVVFSMLLVGALAMVKWLPGPRNSVEAALQYSWLGALYVLMMLVALLQRDGVLTRVLRWRFLREWGRVSYCVYVIHLGVLGTCHWVLLHSLPRIDTWRGVITTVLAASITWGIAQFSWKYFEKPLIDLGHSVSYARAECLSSSS